MSDLVLFVDIFIIVVAGRVITVVLFNIRVSKRTNLVVTNKQTNKQEINKAQTDRCHENELTKKLRRKSRSNINGMT